MLYNTKYIITYDNDENIFNENDNISEREKEFIRDALYRNDLLYIFDIEEYDKDLLSNKLKDLYNVIKTNKELNKTLKKLAEIYLSNDPEIGLLILFSFDFLCISHPIICECLEKGEISKESLDKLNKILI